MQKTLGVRAFFSLHALDVLRIQVQCRSCHVYRTSQNLAGCLERCRYWVDTSIFGIWSAEAAELGPRDVHKNLPNKLLSLMES